MTVETLHKISLSRARGIRRLQCILREISSIISSGQSPCLQELSQIKYLERCFNKSVLDV